MNIKNNKLKIMSMILTLMLLGCSGMTNLNKISIGMTKQQVIEELGNPDSVSANESQEVLIYNFWKEFWDREPGQYSERYFVTLKSNKVVSYGKAGDQVNNRIKTFSE